MKIEIGKPQTPLQKCAYDTLKIFINASEIVELNTIRRNLKHREKLFKLLNKDINNNLKIISESLLSLRENPTCSKLYTDQTFVIEEQFTTIDEIINYLIENIDTLYANTLNEEEEEDPYYIIEILARDMLPLFVDYIIIKHYTFRTMKIPYTYEWITKKELKIRDIPEIKNAKQTIVHLFIELLIRIDVYNKIANQYRHLISNTEYQFLDERFKESHGHLLRGIDYFIDRFKDEKEIQNIIDINKIREIKELITYLKIDNYNQNKEIIANIINYFADFVIYVNREEVIKEIEEKLKKIEEKLAKRIEEEIVVRPIKEPEEPTIIGKDIPIVWGEATLDSYDIQSIRMARIGSKETFEETLDWYINYYFNVYLEKIKDASTEESIKKYGRDHFLFALEDLPYIAPVYKYEYALINPYVIGWDYAFLPLPFVKTDEECKKYNGYMHKYDNINICIRPFGEADQSEWKDEVINDKGGYLKSIKDKILQLTLSVNKYY